MSEHSAKRHARVAAVRDLRPLSFALLAALILLASAIAYFAPKAQAQESPTTAPSGTADVWLVIQEPSDPRPVGSPITYTLKIGNSGPNASTGSFVAAQIDPIASFVSASSACGLASGTLYCELGALAAGAEQTLTVTLTPTSEGMLFLPAGIDGNDADPDATNDTWVEDTTIAPPPPPTVTLVPTADTFVRKAAPSTNYGTLKTLEIDADPVKAALMRFDTSSLSGRQVASAKLRIFNVDPSNRGGSVYTTNGAAWGETTATYASRPRWGTSPVGSLGAVTPGNWYEIDVTAAVGSGNEVTLYLLGNSADAAYYSSREGANPPQLFVRFVEPAPQVTH